MEQPLVQTIGLKKYFEVPEGYLHAVDNVNISIDKGKTLGVVGESGCGKSTLGRVMLRLLDATEGEVLFDGENVLDYTGQQLKKMRREMQIIFQDPYSSLNPRKSIGDIIKEPIIVNKILKDKKAINNRIKELMDVVGLSQRLIRSYPHELDGGRRQRVGIARALSLNPKFIVCDEPVSALDVSIQAQILNLMMDLQEELGITYMFITHDLSVVKHISDEIVVMYLGQCVESAKTEELFKNPMHPYTKALLSAIPIPSIDQEWGKKNIIKGELTSPINPRKGCRFHLRCDHATDKCIDNDINLHEVGEDHHIACALYN
ncbi:MAG: ATP-binding cassette domain-containing protein [Tissierellia bacterium]|nr:ATP-binding cassette domain-containing protein [Tissierellia bacterium]